MLAAKFQMGVRRERHCRKHVQGELLCIADICHEFQEILHGMLPCKGTQPLGPIMKDAVPFRNMKERDVTRWRFKFTWLKDGCAGHYFTPFEISLYHPGW